MLEIRGRPGLPLPRPAIGGAVPSGSAIPRSVTEHHVMSNKKQGQVSQSKPAAETPIDTPPLPTRQTKLATLLELISKNGGSSLDELAAATGWLPHTVRAAVTGLRKRGHIIRCERVDGVSRYQIGSSDQ